MKRLKCPDCGGSVRVLTSPEGHVLGKCEQCANEFVIDAKGRQHVIVEHRIARPDRSPARSVLSGGDIGRRSLLGIGGVLVAGAAASLVWGKRSSPDTGAGQPSAAVVFNVGGEGAGAGQFRDHVFDLGVDSLGRAALIPIPPARQTTRQVWFRNTCGDLFTTCDRNGPPRE